MDVGIRDENHNHDETLAAESVTISCCGHTEPRQALCRGAEAPSSLRPWNYQEQDLARSWNWTEETRTDPQVAVATCFPLHHCHHHYHHRSHPLPEFWFLHARQIASLTIAQPRGMLGCPLDFFSGHEKLARC